MGTPANPVVAGPRTGEVHDLAEYGVGQCGCAVGDIVIGVGGEHESFIAVELEAGSGEQTEIGHNEGFSGGQDVTKMSVEVDNRLTAHMFGRAEQLMHHHCHPTRDVCTAGG